MKSIKDKDFAEAFGFEYKSKRDENYYESENNSPDACFASILREFYTADLIRAGMYAENPFLKLLNKNAKSK